MNDSPRSLKPGPLTLSVFGITGDLSGRKLLPAIYDLARQNLLPDSFRIVGITRRDYKVETLMRRLEKEINSKGFQSDPKLLEELGKKIELFKIDYKNPADFKKLKKHLDKIERSENICMSRIFYLAVPAQIFSRVVNNIGEGKLQNTCIHDKAVSRLLIEKPFGHDLKSAKKLSEYLSQTFSEEQIYRIDHFLAKETTQNIMAFRFENALFRAVWNNHHIKHVLVSAAETIGIEGRANFYEQTGALRDMIQSHVLQMLALATMELPKKITPDSLHSKKLKLLKSIKPADPELAARGQYEGYADEVGNPKSSVETYAALELYIDNERWQGIPMIIRTGKSLAYKSTAITILFGDASDKSADNSLTMRLAPNEGISLHLRAKKPGFDNKMQDVTMDFDYRNSFYEERQPTAYERILVDAFKGDNSLFSSTEEVLASWEIITPLLEAWTKDDQGLEKYNQGSMGPAGADEIVKKHQANWYHPD